MPEPVYKAELLRSLGCVVRGLSALFWGMPAALLSYVQTARTDWLQGLGIFSLALPLALTSLLFYGLTLMARFQKQERVWLLALDRARLMVLVNLGLCPFLYWWHQVPDQPLFEAAVGLLAVSSLVFLYNLNHVLLRLVAMLPDETLRLETRMFTSFNASILLVLPILVGVYVVLSRLHGLPRLVQQLLVVAEATGGWMLLFLLLMPLAMTMALVWKIKEVIFSSVFHGEANS